MDFIIFKPIVKAICDSLDHRTLLPRFNASLEVTESEDKVEARHTDGSYFCFPRRDVLVLDIPNNVDGDARPLPSRARSSIRSRASFPMAC